MLVIAFKTFNAIICLNKYDNATTTMIILVDDRLFVTAIREKGAPVSVMTITDQRGEGGALLRPYPDWSWYKDDCKGITGGVYRLDVNNEIF